MSEEKFVTIPYDVWNSKYKPMESDLEEIKGELAREKENKKIEITLRYWSTWYKGYNHKNIGSIDIDINGSYRINWNKNQIESSFSEFIRNETIDGKNTFLFKRDATKHQEEMEKLLNKAEIIAYNNDEKVKKLSWFVRWLFGIKKIW